MTQFTGAWSLPSVNLVGVEIPQTPVNSAIGSYGFRSLGISTLSCSALALGAAYINDVNGDTGRDNAEILFTRQVAANTVNTGHRSGGLLRGSGAASAENGYIAYLQEETKPLIYRSGLTSIVPEAGPAPTSFSRNLAAYVTDHEGRLVLCKANEARFQGARRVENLCTSSESTAAWGVSGTTLPTATSTSVGGDTYSGGTLPSGGSGFGYSALLATGSTFSANRAMDATQKYAWRLKLFFSRPLVAAEQINLIVTGGDGFTKNILFSNSFCPQTPTTCGVANDNPQITANTNSSFYFYVAGALSTPISVYAKYYQIEETTGQSNQNPGDYVSTGVLSAPFQGTNVDGVKCFTTLNGNTVTANVVAEATGAAISDTVLDGRLNEAAATNLCLNSADLSGFTLNATTRTLNAATGPTGQLTMSKISDTTAVGASHNAQSPAITITAGSSVALSLYVKQADFSECEFYLIGTGGRLAGIKFTFAGAVLSAAAYAPVTYSIASSSVDTLINGVYRINLVIATATDTSVTAQFYPKNANAYTGTGQGTYAWQMDIAASGTVTSPIITTTAPVTRPKDLLIDPLSTISDTAGTAYAEVKALNWAAVGNQRIFGSADDGAGTCLSVNSNGIHMYDLTNVVNNTFTAFSGRVKAGSVWGAGTMRGWANGALFATDSPYDGSFNLSAVAAGFGAGTPFNGTIRNEARYAYKMLPSSIPADFAVNGGIVNLVTAKLVSGVETLLSNAFVSLRENGTPEPDYLVLTNTVSADKNVVTFSTPPPAGAALTWTAGATGPFGFATGDGFTKLFYLPVTTAGQQSIFVNGALGNSFQYLSPRTNLAPSSQDFTTASWSTPNVTVAANAVTAPDGTFTGTNVSNTPSTNSFISQSTAGAAFVAGQSYTRSIHAKANTGTGELYFEARINGTLALATFNVITGATTAGGGLSVSSVLVAGWYRISVTMTAAGPGSNGFAAIYIGGYGSTPTPTTIGVWGVQTEIGPIATPYIVNTTSASAVTVTDITLFGMGLNNLNFAVTPLAGAVLSWTAPGVGPLNIATADGVAANFTLPTTPAGAQTIYKNDWQGNQLQSKVARTNTIQFSEQLTSWATSSMTVTGGAATAPDGTSTANQLAISGTGVDAFAGYGSVVTGATCFSVFVKSGGTTPSSAALLRTLVYATTLQDDPLYFNYATKTFSGVTGGYLSYGYVDLGAGWFRLWGVKAAQPGQTSVEIRVSPWSTASGYVVGQTTLAWGGDVKAATTLSSYIKTGAAAVTVTDVAVTAANPYVYYQISGANRTIVAGDYLEYDYYVDSQTTAAAPLGCGSMEIDFSDGTVGRGLALVDQNAEVIHFANPPLRGGQGVWIHRKISLALAVGKVPLRWDLVNEADTVGTYVVRYRNILVTDGAGATRATIYKAGAPSMSGVAYANLNSYTLDYTYNTTPDYVAVLQDMYIRFRANGTTVSARCWKYGTIEPTAWQLSTVDTSVTGVGYVGLFSRSIPPNSMAFDYPGFVSAGTSGETAPRPRSELEFRDWLNDTSNQRVVIAEMGVLGQSSAGAANPSKVLVSNWPFTTRGSDTPRNQSYDDVIVDVPVFTSRVADNLTGRPTQAFGDLVIKNEGGVRDPWLNWNWDGSDFTMMLGGVGWRKWDFYRVMSGSIYEAYSPSKDKLGFKIRDKSVLLNRKLQTTTIGGTTANAGLPRPITYGQVFNAQPQLKDAATLRYTLNDTSLTGTTGIVQVRDSGVSVAFTADLANGEFTLTAAPTNTGSITADVTNNLRGYKHADILTDVIENRVGLTAYKGARTGSLASFGASYSAPVGLYINAEANVMDVLDQVASSAGGFWYFNRLGQFCAALVRVPNGTFDHVLIEDDLDTAVTVDRLIRPSAVEQLGYQANWTPQTTLAGSVTVANRALYAAPAQYTAVTPTYSGLDQPANHSLRQLPKNRGTLFVNSSDAAAEVTRNDLIYRKNCGIYSFTTKANSVFYNLGESLQLTYSRYGFQNGRAGVIVGLEENFKNSSVRISLFVQNDGQFPVTDTVEPYVAAKDFYAN